MAETLQPLFLEIDRLTDLNGRKVRKACRDHQLGPHHFAGSTGYGHGDLGRDTLDKIVAQTFGAERALVRHTFVSGTHAIATALYGVLRPGDDLICITGKPYDTLHEVIGCSAKGHQSKGSLLEWGINYREIELNEHGLLNFDALTDVLSPRRKQVVYLQRSCGYALRPTIRVDEMETVIAHVKNASPKCLVLVDNCYGEFTEEIEPTHVGADFIMGSLIKNAGGTIVSSGGYVAGRRDLIEQVHARLTAPGIGVDAGSIPGETLRLMCQGNCFYLAPQMTGEALKSTLLISRVMHSAGYKVLPRLSDQCPYSLITAIVLGSETAMIEFCKAVQHVSPVGSYVNPIPGSTSGYVDSVIFADGTFVDGSTSEMSADGPIRMPYAVYCQGGTHWTQWAEALESVLLSLGTRS